MGPQLNYRMTNSREGTQTREYCISGKDSSLNKKNHWLEGSRVNSRFLFIDLHYELVLIQDHNV